MKKVSLNSFIRNRFWAKVNKDGPVQPHVPGIGPCWQWTACVNEHGYGDFCVGSGYHDKAPRVSWMLHHGEIKEGLFVLHRCDNPRCVNPDHLFLGTQKDNIDDMRQKGRHRNKTFKGEANGFSKLTWNQVREIRQRHQAGENKTALAFAFFTSRQNIGHIVRNEHWKE